MALMFIHSFVTWNVPSKQKQEPTAIQGVKFEKHVYGKKRKDCKVQPTLLLRKWVLLIDNSTVLIVNQFLKRLKKQKKKKRGKNGFSYHST